MTAGEVLQPAIAYLAAGLLAGLAARAARVSVVVGYLLAGVIIGPHALKIVDESNTTIFLAELGMVFLLFDIGLHFSVRDLQKSRKDLLGLAPAQMIMTAIAFALLGRLIGCSWPVAAAIGLSLSLSSTAVVTRILADRNKPGCPMGRSATAVLVAQDVLAIFLIAFAASLTSDYASLAMEMGRAMGLAFVCFIAALIGARYLVRPVFRALAETRNEEAFTVLALLLVLAASFFTSVLELSLTLGGFLAGMMISDTPYRHIVQTEVKPFRSLLLGLFFISVGMTLNVPALMEIWPIVALMTAGIIIIKTVLTFLAARLNGWSRAGGAQLAFILSQGSEFTLIIAAALGTAIPSPWRGAIVASVALTFLVAPMWFALGEWISRKLAAQQSELSPDKDDPTFDKPRVLVFGMTREGRFAVDALRDLKIPFAAIDYDPDRFVAAVSDGYEVNFGDLSDLRLLQSFGGQSVCAVVLGASRFEVSKHINQSVQEHFPNLQRYVAARDDDERRRFEDIGVSAFVSRTRPYGMEMVADLLTGLGVEQDAIADWMREQAESRGILERRKSDQTSVESEDSPSNNVDKSAKADSDVEAA